jgi:RNA polymerase sigma-70 factor (ECF subfamily)
MSHLTVETQNSNAALSELDERELLERLLADDADGWREFNRRYGRLIYQAIHKVLGRFRSVVSADEPSEVYASLCLQLLSNDKRKLKSFDADRGSRLSSWLHLLATHATYDFLRVRRREPYCDELTTVESHDSGSPDPFVECAIRERAAHLTELIESLSERDREFVDLHFRQGLEPEDVAERMGISVKTVYTKKHKIRDRLEGLLAEWEAAA